MSSTLEDVQINVPFSCTNFPSVGKLRKRFEIFWSYSYYYAGIDTARRTSIIFRHGDSPRVYKMYYMFEKVHF